MEGRAREEIWGREGGKMKDTKSWYSASCAATRADEFLEQIDANELHNKILII